MAGLAFCLKIALALLSIASIMGGKFISSKHFIHWTISSSYVSFSVLRSAWCSEREGQLARQACRLYLERLKSLANAVILGFSCCLAILLASEIRVSISLDDLDIVVESSSEKWIKWGVKKRSAFKQGAPTPAGVGQRRARQLKNKD